MAAQPWLPNGVGGWPHRGLSGGLHTRLLGFVKTALMRQLVAPKSLVCDLFCGRGLDTETWAEAGIRRYIGVDLSASALEEAKEQWEQHDKPFPAEFCELHPCMVDLEAHLQDQGLPADIVSCLAHLQDSFTSEEMVKGLLRNVEAMLKPGGFFFGTAPDSSTIWYNIRVCKYQKAQEAAKSSSGRPNGIPPAVRTENYKLTFDDDRFLPYVSKYHIRFSDDGLPAQPQLLVHFPSLIKLAKEVGLECVQIQNLLDFYDDYSGPFADVLRSCCGSVMDQKGVPVLDGKGRLNVQSLDVLSLYTTFIFKKEDTSLLNVQVSPTVEPALKPSSSVAKYLTNFPSHRSKAFSVGVSEGSRKKEKQVLKGDDRLRTVPINISEGVSQNELSQQASSFRNPEVNAVDVVEVHPDGMAQSELRHDKDGEASGPISNGCTVDNADKIVLVSSNGDMDQKESWEDELTMRHSSPSDRKESTIDDNGQPVRDQMLEVVADERELRPDQSQETHKIGGDALLERETSGQQETGGARRQGSRSESGTSRSSALTDPGQARLMEHEYGVKHVTQECDLSALEEANEGVHDISEGESLNESRQDRQKDGQQPLHQSPKRYHCVLDEDLDAGRRGGVGQSPKHYKRRAQENLDESTRSDNETELALEDNSAKHYFRRVHENRDGGGLEDNRREQSMPDHDSKSRRRLAHESQDQSTRQDMENGSPSADRTARHYKRRIRVHENRNESTQLLKLHQGSSNDTSSKHMIYGVDESSRREYGHVEQCRVEVDRSKWVVRASSQEQKPTRITQTSQAGVSARIVLKKFASNSTSAKTARRD